MVLPAVRTHRYFAFILRIDKKGITSHFLQVWELRFTHGGSNSKLGLFPLPFLFFLWWGQFGGGELESQGGLWRETNPEVTGLQGRSQS